MIQDIRALLLDWKDELDLCDRIFIRANTANRRIFLDFDDTPIVKGIVLPSRCVCA